MKQKLINVPNIDLNEQSRKQMLRELCVVQRKMSES